LNVKKMRGQNDEIARLLADTTRFGIYQAVIGAGTPVTVAEIAEQFKLHPNVARMHLEKLAGSGLLGSAYRKSPGGGRPAREYSVGSRVAAQRYPPRDYRLLADIVLTALESGRKAETVARQAGCRIGEEALAARGIDPAKATRKSLEESLRQITEEQGLYASISRPAADSLELEINNCIFKELSAEHSDSVCRLHRYLFAGISESHFGKVRVSSRAGIAKGANCCRFTVTRQAGGRKA